jgi:hypothetical protein
VNGHRHIHLLGRSPELVVLCGRIDLAARKDAQQDTLQAHFGGVGEFGKGVDDIDPRDDTHPE